MLHHPFRGLLRASVEFRATENAPIFFDASSRNVFFSKLFNFKQYYQSIHQQLLIPWFCIFNKEHFFTFFSDWATFALIYPCWENRFQTLACWLFLFWTKMLRALFLRLLHYTRSAIFVRRPKQTVQQEAFDFSRKPPLCFFCLYVCQDELKL